MQLQVVNVFCVQLQNADRRLRCCLSFGLSQKNCVELRRKAGRHFAASKIQWRLAAVVSKKKLRRGGGFLPHPVEIPGEGAAGGNGGWRRRVVRASIEFEGKFLLGEFSLF